MRVEKRQGQGRELYMILWRFRLYPQTRESHRFTSTIEDSGRTAVRNKNGGRSSKEINMNEK